VIPQFALHCMFHAIFYSYMKLPNTRQNTLQQNFSIKYTNRNVVPTTTTVTYCV